VVGFEAIDDQTLADFNKQTDVTLNEKANQIMIEYNIINYAQFLIKSESTCEDFRRIWNYIFKQGIIHPSLAVLTPLPGTQMFQDPRLLFPKEYQYYDLVHPLLPTQMPPEEFHQELIKIFKNNYSLKRWVLAKIKRMINWISGRKKYPWYETTAPEFYYVFFSFWWLRRQITYQKRSLFYKKFKAHDKVG